MKLVEIEDGRLINWNQIIWVDVFESEIRGIIVCQISLVNMEMPLDFLNLNDLFSKGILDSKYHHISYAACFLQIACELIDSSSKKIIDYDYIMEESYNRFINHLKQGS